jgi:ARG/rhodanese/phosphatase superfamily protein
MPEMSTQNFGNGGNQGDFVRNALDGLQVGPRTTFKKLTVFPLFKATSVTPAYLTLAEALAEGLLRVTEVSQSGSVPELHVVNSSDRPVFLLDGEELIGAKQNRVVNLSILVPAKTELNIPVSCVESGRWSYRSPEFEASPHAMYASGRARKLSRVTGSLRDGARTGDQHDVWAGIEEQSAMMAVSSPTHAMSDMYDQYATSIDEYVAAFQASDDQVGALFAIGPRIYGFELFDAPATMRAYLEKLVRSYAIDALAMRNVADEPPAAESAQQLLESAAQAASETYPALGLGVDVRVREKKVVGAGLLWQEHMVHLNAFTDATAYRAPRRREAES